MKKKTIILAFLALISISVFHGRANAAEISVGATTWYAWWDFDNTEDNQQDKTLGPELLYGPAMSVKFNDEFNLTFVFLYGKFEMENDESEDVKRYDSDLALNYRLNTYFKIFAGGKYMAYKTNTDFEHIGYGPGVGISAVLPLGSNFYVLGNISGMYLWGAEDSSDSKKQTYNEYGMNSGLSLAYYIVPASVTLSLGGRFQYFKTVMDSSENTTDMKHQFYGITAAATYSFSL